METVKYKRVLLKLSGEALAGEDKFGVNESTINDLCKEVKKIVNMGVEVAIVVGGGNFWRGRNGESINRSTADYMGMLATVMNGLAMQDALEAQGVEARLQTSIEMTQIAEPFVERKAKDYLKNGKVVIFACGTGHPYFTTDTAASLKAIEMNADILLLGKSIDAVYSDDPKINPNAIRYTDIIYDEVLEQNLKVMDITATAMCKDNNMPLLVFGIKDPENIIKAVKGENVGTVVHN